MRDKIVPAVLGLAFIGVMVFSAVRAKAPHEAPLVVIQDEGKVDAGADASSVSDAAPVVDAAQASVDAAEAGPPAVVKLLDRPLRITTLGLALAAPGTMVHDAVEAARDGGAPRASLEMEVTTVSTAQKLEARLVHGGADADGADVAILSLPDLVASAERLRALEPQAFMVVGFSQSTERFHPLGASPKIPPQGTDVKVHVPPGERLASREWTALFALDAAQVPLARVKLLAVDERPKDAQYVATTFLEKNEGEHVLSTVEAPGLVPYVAVATKGLLSSKEAVLRAFAEGWILGMQRSYVDAAGAAKRVIGKEGVVFSAASEGTGDLTAIVDQLGRISKVGLADEARYFGVPAKEGRRGPLAALASQMVEIFGEAGLTATPPTWELVDPKIVAHIAKDTPPSVERLECARARKGPILVRRENDKAFDEAALQRKIESAALVFEGCALRVSLRAGEKGTTTFVESTRDKLGLSAAKLVVGKTPTQGSPAVVEAVPPAP